MTLLEMLILNYGVKVIFFCNYSAITPKLYQLDCYRPGYKLVVKIQNYFNFGAILDCKLQKRNDKIDLEIIIRE